MTTTAQISIFLIGLAAGILLTIRIYSGQAPSSWLRKALNYAHQRGFREGLERGLNLKSQIDSTDKKVRVFRMRRGFRRRIDPA
jgi:hypothetical protein